MFMFSDDCLQTCQKRRRLGCVNPPPAATGSQDAGLRNLAIAFFDMSAHLGRLFQFPARWCRLSLEARESVNWLPSRLSVQLNRFPSVNVIPLYNSLK